ncbi:MAG: anaerobic ribonucleoside-triphosphate reductase activating protein [bacterium]
MKVSGINFESIVDGYGVRVVIYLSGCLHNCKGCHNPETHSFSYGEDFGEEYQQNIIDYINKTPFVKGITFSGGDPMYSAKELLVFLKKIKKQEKNINVWIYSGFTYEKILKNSSMKALLRYADVLVDGRFELELKNLTLKFKGSENQRTINLLETRKNNCLTLLE